MISDALWKCSRNLHLKRTTIKSKPPRDREIPNPNDPNSNLTLNSSRKLTSVDSLTFSEQVSLKSANRDFILQKLIENRLDDRHDLQGNSLYIFKFDTTVVTSEFSDKKAMVEVELVPPIAGDVSADKDTFLISALEDQFSASLLRDAFDQFIGDTYDRINRALKKSNYPSPIDMALAPATNTAPSANPEIDRKKLPKPGLEASPKNLDWMNPESAYRQLSWGIRKRSRKKIDNIN